MERIEKLAAAHPCAIVLREKDLNESEYKSLAKKVLEICNDYNTPCILHSFTETAIDLKADAIHLPLHILRTLSSREKSKFSVIGASCHSKEDAIEAKNSGCTYITAGHIFNTDCKKGLPGRGLDFLKEVCESISIPVYAIGGINADNICAVKNTGAAGACIMSSAMLCDNPQEYFNTFEEK